MWNNLSVANRNHGIHIIETEKLSLLESISFQENLVENLLKFRKFKIYNKSSFDHLVNRYVKIKLHKEFLPSDAAINKSPSTLSRQMLLKWNLFWENSTYSHSKTKWTMQVNVSMFEVTQWRLLPPLTRGIIDINISKL